MLEHFSSRKHRLAIFARHRNHGVPVFVNSDLFGHDVRNAFSDFKGSAAPNPRPTTPGSGIKSLGNQTPWSSIGTGLLVVVGLTS